MLRFLVDEDLPRSLAPALRAAGHAATDVGDEGLRGQADERVFRFAKERGFALLTGDMPSVGSPLEPRLLSSMAVGVMVMKATPMGIEPMFPT
jgi:hypothetical protein